MQLAEFMAHRKEARSFPFRYHVKHGLCKAYLRMGMRAADQHIVFCITLATVDVHEKHEGKGHFKAFAIELERQDLPVFVEQIFNRELRDMLLKNGYRIVRDSHDSFDMYKDSHVSYVKRPKQWHSAKVCPLCSSRATKIMHLDTGRYTCQICDTRYRHPLEL